MLALPCTHISNTVEDLFCTYFFFVHRQGVIQIWQRTICQLFEQAWHFLPPYRDYSVSCWGEIRPLRILWSKNFNSSRSEKHQQMLLTTPKALGCWYWSLRSRNPPPFTTNYSLSLRIVSNGLKQSSWALSINCDSSTYFALFIRNVKIKHPAVHQRSQCFSSNLVTFYKIKNYEIKIPRPNEYKEISLSSYSRSLLMCIADLYVCSHTDQHFVT